MSETILRTENGYDAIIGRVEYFNFGIKDHGILTFMVGLDFKGTGQGFGGYSLDSYDKKTEKRIGTVFGTECVLRLLRCFGVDDVSKIKGKPCLALYKIPYETFSSKIVGIAPLPSDDGEPFILEDCLDFCKKLEKKN